MCKDLKACARCHRPFLGQVIPESDMPSMDFKNVDMKYKVKLSEILFLQV